MHLYVTVIGGYAVSAGALAAETWQFGCRFVALTGDIDPIGQLPLDTEVYPRALPINRNYTDWTITGNWVLEMGVNDLDPGDWLNDQLAPATKTLLNATGLMRQDAYVREIKVYPIDQTGHVAPAVPYVTGTPCVLTTKTATAIRGQATTAMFPPQVSLVASLRTAQVGPGGRGRIYLPALAASNGTTVGLLDPTRQSAIANLVASWLANCRLDLADKAYPAVIPQAQSAPEVYALIDTVRVDNVFDTQRRRRRSIVPTTVSATVTPPA